MQSVWNPRWPDAHAHLLIISAQVTNIQAEYPEATTEQEKDVLADKVPDYWTLITETFTWRLPYEIKMQEFSQNKGLTIILGSWDPVGKMLKKSTFKGDKDKRKIEVKCTKATMYIACNSNNPEYKQNSVSLTWKAKPEFWHLLSIWMVTCNFLQLNIIVTNHDVYPSFCCILYLRSLLARICIYNVFRRNAQVLHQCHFRLKNRNKPEFDTIQCTIFTDFLLHVL